jgi:hypothetical protein
MLSYTYLILHTSGQLIFVADVKMMVLASSDRENKNAPGCHIAPITEYSLILYIVNHAYARVNDIKYLQQCLHE